MILMYTHGLHVDSHVDNITRWTSPLCPNGIHNDIAKIINPNIYDINRTSEWNLKGLDCYDENEPVTFNVTNKIQYNYYIPSQHYPGSHWYHAHWHGSTTLEVVNGLYGLFIIEENINRYKPNMINVPLSISYAFLHTYEKCKEITYNLTNNTYRTDELKYRRPINVSSLYPLNFPIQSLCIIYCKQNDPNGAEARFI